MEKHWIVTVFFVLVSAYFLRGIIEEKKMYIDITRDCSVYKNSDHKQFMRCWRSKRNASYSLRKRLGDYEQELVEEDR